MVCTAEPSGVRRPPWEVPPSRRPIVQRPRADCEDDPVPGRTTRPERKALHNEPRLDDPFMALPPPTARKDRHEIHAQDSARPCRSAPAWQHGGRSDRFALTLPVRRTRGNSERPKTGNRCVELLDSCCASSRRPTQQSHPPYLAAQTDWGGAGRSWLVWLGRKDRHRSCNWQHPEPPASPTSTVSMCRPERHTPTRLPSAADTALR